MITWGKEATQKLYDLWQAGKTSPEIADALGLSTKTVMSKISSLRRKGVDLRSRGKTLGGATAKITLWMSTDDLGWLQSTAITENISTVEKARRLIQAARAAINQETDNDGA